MYALFMYGMSVDVLTCTWWASCAISSADSASLDWLLLYLSLVVTDNDIHNEGRDIGRVKSNGFCYMGKEPAQLTGLEQVLISW